MWILYQIATAVALAAAGPFLLARRGLHHLPSLAARLRGPAAGGERGALWLHAVSVGEVAVAATLARALPANLPLLVTTVTPTGQERAHALFAGRARVAYLPFDLGPPVSRFLAHLAPSALVLVEGDLWPLLLAAVKRRGLPVAVVNGRVSDASFRRMRRVKRWLGPLLAPVDAFGVQTAADRERLLALGVAPERVAVTGNLKFEGPDPAPNRDLEALVRAAAGGRPVLVAGSTMAGEEAAVLAAFAAIGGGGRALLLLAPRHRERFEEAASLLAARGLATARRSRPAGAAGRPAVLLLDSLGELAGAYRLAAASFIGGTLVPTGGHNPLEPARYGVPVAVGPSLQNFREIAALFDAAEAWTRVDGPGALAAAWEGWLSEPAAARRLGGRGRALVEANRGALARTLELLAPLLAAAAAAEPSAAGGRR